MSVRKRTKAPPAHKQPPVLFVRKGATITQEGREYVVLRVVDLNRVLAREASSEETVLLNIGSVEAPRRLQADAAAAQQEIELESVSTEAWAIAESRLKIIEPLLNSRPRRTKADYAEAAKAAGVDARTVYRWLDAYRGSGLLSSLLPDQPRGGRGNSRLRPEVELILKDYVENHHLTLQKPSVLHSAKEIRRLCFNAGLEPLPAVSTIHRHIGWISGEVKLARREGTKAAREKYAVHKGSIPDAEWPLSMVQIDHTMLPVLIVDDEHRKPINRTWVTFAIDVFSRVCLGMYLSLDAPSAMSAGMCIAHAVLPKDAWLARIGCADVEWPFYGVMDVLHMDNAREFRGNMLRLAATEYHIDLHLRPVKVPHYGAHIERLMGTVSQGLKHVKGATFSGPKEKGVYDAEGNACMTFDELEKWLVLFFARYHRDMHNGIGTTPLAKWREGILGTRKKPGRGLPGRRTDVEKVRIDFMPFEERTVQDYGVVIDEVHYFHDVLRPWVNSMDPEHPRERRKFRFRYDPRDISQLYFFEPNVKRYFAIPYRDSGLPPASIWELRDARREALKRGVDSHDEREVFGLITRQRELETASAAKTKAARRAQQKRVLHEKARKQTKQDLSVVSNPAPTTAPEVLRGYDPDSVKAIDDDA